MEQVFNQFNLLIALTPVCLKEFSTEDLTFKAQPEKWSKKELIGHLIDSALHNLKRFTYAQFEELEIQQYPQVELVKVNQYQHQSVQHLIDLWSSLNKQLLSIVKSLSHKQLQSPINNSGASFREVGKSLTLQWLIEDYVIHLEHHLKQIFETKWPLKPQKIPARLAASHQNALETLVKSNFPFVELFQDDLMSVELYAPKGKDLQSPHNQDELYVIIQGSGQFELEGELIPFKALDVLFVPAGRQHRFVDFTTDFQTWVIFYGPKGGKPTTHWQKDHFELNARVSQLDITFVHQFLTNSYWAKGRTMQEVQASIEQSYAFGLYDGEQQIGFARVITDCTTFAYLADVFVDDTYRGQGLGKWMVDCIVNAERFKGCKWLLKTLDAQGLYHQIGFSKAGKSPEIMVK